MKRWLKWTLTIVVLAVLSTALYFAFFQSDWIQPIVRESGVFGYVIYTMLNIVITTLMTFVPGMTFTFTLLATQLFGTLNGFIIATFSCFLSSLVKFFIGDKLGEPVIDWLVGKETRIKAQNLVSDRATVLVPVMLAFPFFPDDAICMISGMTKMKYWYFAIVALLCRTIGVGVTAFLGSNILNYASFTLLDWILFINIIIIDVWLIWKLSGYVEKVLRTRRDRRVNKDDNK